MIILAAETKLPAPVFFILGLSVVVYESWVGYSTLTRWEWFRNRYSWIARWGNGLTGFPASRMGVLYGVLTGMSLGVAMIGAAMHWEMPEESSGLVIGILFWAIAGPLIVVRDYFLYLDGKAD